MPLLWRLARAMPAHCGAITAADSKSRSRPTGCSSLPRAPELAAEHSTGLCRSVGTYLRRSTLGRARPSMCRRFAALGGVLNWGDR